MPEGSGGLGLINVSGSDRKHDGQVTLIQRHKTQGREEQTTLCQGSSSSSSERQGTGPGQATSTVSQQVGLLAAVRSLTRFAKA